MFILLAACALAQNVSFGPISPFDQFSLDNGTIPFLGYGPYVGAIATCYDDTMSLVGTRLKFYNGCAPSYYGSSVAVQNSGATHQQNPDGTYFHEIWISGQMWDANHQQGWQIGTTSNYGGVAYWEGAGAVQHNQLSYTLNAKHHR